MACQCARCILCCNILTCPPTPLSLCTDLTRQSPLCIVQTYCFGSATLSWGLQIRQARPVQRPARLLNSAPEEGSSMNLAEAERAPALLAAPLMLPGEDRVRFWKRERSLLAVALHVKPGMTRAAEFLVPVQLCNRALSVPWPAGTPLTAHCCLYTIVHYSLYTITHFCLHTAACTLLLAHCCLHTAACTLLLAHCRLYTIACTLLLAHCCLHTAACLL